MYAHTCSTSVTIDVRYNNNSYDNGAAADMYVYRSCDNTIARTCKLCSYACARVFNLSRAEK